MASWRGSKPFEAAIIALCDLLEEVDKTWFGGELTRPGTDMRRHSGIYMPIERLLAVGSVSDVSAGVSKRVLVC